MIAFDTDVLTEVLLGDAALVGRAAAIPVRDQAVPVIVIEEIIRGRLNVIRQAEAGRANVGIARAYGSSRRVSGTFVVFTSFRTPLKQSHSTDSGGSKGFASPRTICGLLLPALPMQPD